MDKLPSGSASLAWDRLKTRFEPKTGATLTQLKKEFTSSKLQRGESPDEWIERLETIRNTIEQILGRQHIDNTEMMLHIINNLPEDYEIIINRVTVGYIRKIRTKISENIERKKDRKIENQSIESNESKIEKQGQEKNSSNRQD